VKGSENGRFADFERGQPVAMLLATTSVIKIYE
jgi:hypothetical protein